ncbi:MAG: protease inhibitor I9 family protein [Balneolaceae bacterium]|nr:protease inhibitor I9 family protein [Balneolaceae bacterium]MCH8549429.1 protease inhibitor I9 family protein [Balneolaceae bacterium]
MNDLQNFPYLIVFITIFALASFTACEDNVSVQDAGPQVIEGEYIVTFQERWDGEISSEVAEEVRAFTDQFLEDVEIPADSVLSRFEYSTRGFAARIDEEKAISLMLDDRVDRVTQNRLFNLYN